MTYLEDILTEEELRNWKEKMNEPLKAVDVSEEELEELRKEGLI